MTKAHHSLRCAFRYVAVGIDAIGFVNVGSLIGYIGVIAFVFGFLGDSVDFKAVVGGLVVVLVILVGCGVLGALVSNERRWLSPPLRLDGLSRNLGALVPLRYAEILVNTLADLHLERSAAVAEGRPLKACWVLLNGYGALAKAAICQLGLSLLDRIASLGQAKGPK